MNDTFQPRRLEEEQHTDPVELPTGDTLHATQLRDMPLQKSNSISYKQYAEKIKSQASLLEKYEKYILLCEQRVLELCPGHPMPLEKKHMGKQTTAHTDRPNQYHELKKALNFKDQELHFANIKISQLTAEINKYDISNISNIVAEKSNLEKALRKETLINEEQRNYIQILKKEIEEVNNDQGVAPYKEKIVQSTNAIKQIEQENNEYQLKIIELNDQLMDATKQIAQRDEKISMLTNNASECVGRIDLLQKEIMDVKAKHSQAQSMLECSQRELKEKIQHIGEYEQQIAQAKENTSKDIEKYQKEIETYKTKNQELHNESQSFRELNQTQKKEYEQEKSTHTNQVKKLENDIQNIQQQISKYQKDICELEETKNEYEKHKQTCNEQLSKLTTELNTSTQHNSKLLNELNDAKKEISNQTRTNEQFKMEADTTLKERETQLIILKQKMQEISKEKERKEDELKNATENESKHKQNRQIKYLQTQLEAYQQINEKITDELNHTKQELSDINYKQVEQNKNYESIYSQNIEILHDKENSQLFNERAEMQMPSPVKCHQCSQAAEYLKMIIGTINQFVYKFNTNSQFANTIKTQLTSNLKQALKNSEQLTMSVGIVPIIKKLSEWMQLLINELEQITIGIIQLRVENSQVSKKLDRARKSISISMMEDDEGKSRVNKSVMMGHRSTAIPQSYTSLRKYKQQSEDIARIRESLEKSVDI